MWLRRLRQIVRGDEKREAEVDRVVEQAQKITDRIDRLRRITEEENRRLGGST